LKEKDYQVNQAKSKKMIFRLSIAFVLLSVAIMFALKIMLVFNIISRKYDTIMLVLPISLLTGIVTSLTGVFSFHLLYLNKLFLIIIIGIPLAFLGIALNNKLVPLYNIYGAAVSSLVLNLCYLISYVLMVDFLYKRKAKIDKARI
jgi:O-antigen/teichoic acid export membrane protein